jgi:hypothetical protein
MEVIGTMFLSTKRLVRNHKRGLVLSEPLSFFWQFGNLRVSIEQINEQFDPAPRFALSTYQQY